MSTGSESSKVYLVRGGRRGEDEEYALQNNVAVVGFHEVGSLEGLADYDAILELVRSGYPDAKSRRTGNFARQLASFALSIQIGDLIVLPQKRTSQIAIGRVTGPYRYQNVGGSLRHTRPLQWLQTDIPRTRFRQDLLYSFGAFMTVCNISRNDAVGRVQAVLRGEPDPGMKLSTGAESQSQREEETDGEADFRELAHDQIVHEIQTRFSGHALTGLVEAVLSAEGWTTTQSPPGPDGGVDILAGRGPLGLDPPRLCVQVKSQTSPTDVTVYRGLQGTMQSFKAEQGLLVCWGGFNRAVLQESRQSHFTVRLWGSGDLVAAVYRTYESLPAEIQAELPLERVWMKVPEESDG
ncbi:MAG: restriction endonuclease [Gammaproteobacteria bacterium]|nr:restriction endonuclease [Gammaproteobacteria bacterium]